MRADQTGACNENAHRSSLFYVQSAILKVAIPSAILNWHIKIRTDLILLICRIAGDCRTKFSVPASSADPDRKSTRLNSSHGYISYAVFCLKKINLLLLLLLFLFLHLLFLLRVLLLFFLRLLRRLLLVLVLLFFFFFFFFF